MKVQRWARFKVSGVQGKKTPTCKVNIHEIRKSRGTRMQSRAILIKHLQNVELKVCRTTKEPRRRGKYRALRDKSPSLIRN